MALELQIITSYEFVRVGAHGELDWDKSMEVLRALALSFLERCIDLAIVDVRDARTSLTDEQLEALVLVLEEVGFRDHHRVAILNRPRAEHRAPVFVHAAKEWGFDVAEFTSYEKAVEWLSAPLGKDPDFDREVYLGPEAHEDPAPKPPESPPKPKSPKPPSPPPSSPGGPW